MKIPVGGYRIPKTSCDFSHEYEDRAVVYLDILGSQELIAGKAHPNAIMHVYNQVYQCLSSSITDMKFMYYLTERMFNENLQEEATKIDHFEISYFSDSIIISIPLIGDKENEILVADLLGKLNLSLSLLFDQGITVRGGMCLGKLYHKNNYCVGPGLVKAYHLEREASYPIIRLDESISTTDELFKVYEHDENGIYISPLTIVKNQMRLLEYGRDAESLNLTIDFIKRLLLSTLKSICALVNHPKRSVKQKGLWLLRKHRILAEKLISHLEEHSRSTNEFKDKINTIMRRQ